MTPTADLTPLATITESAGDTGLSDALIGSLLGAGLTGGLGLLAMIINVLYQNKRHQDELTEKRTDRIFEIKLRTARELHEALTQLPNLYPGGRAIDSFIKHLHKVRELLIQVSFLFSTEVRLQTELPTLERLLDLSQRLSDELSKQERVRAYHRESRYEEPELLGYLELPYELEEQGTTVKEEENRIRQSIESLRKQIIGLQPNLHEDINKLTEALRKELGVHL